MWLCVVYVMHIFSRYSLYSRFGRLKWSLQNILFNMMVFNPKPHKCDHIGSYYVAAKKFLSKLLSNLNLKKTANPETVCLVFILSQAFFLINLAMCPF